MRGWTFLGISTSDLAADRIPLPMKFEDSAGEMTPTTERSRDGGHAPRPRMPAKRIRDFLGRQSLGGGGHSRWGSRSADRGRGIVMKQSGTVQNSRFLIFQGGL